MFTNPMTIPWEGSRPVGRRQPVIVIRTDHKRDFIKPSFGNRLLISQLTDGIITFSERGRREDAEQFQSSS